MLMQQERETIVFYGRKLITSNLTTGSGGNLSIINRQTGQLAIKPTGVDYLEMRPEDVVVVDLDGKIVDGRLRPSSEISLHLGLLKARPDIHAVIHTHQVYATTLACLNWEIPAVHYLVGFSGQKVPLAPYATYGTPELAQYVVQSIGQYNACLMANHGIVTVGTNLAAAFNVAEELELVARLYYQAMCIGKPQILSDSEMEVVIQKFTTYGQPQPQ
ncbi:MAG: L-fuculose-phosphate aldolase [Anaerolineae bacterium]|nr:L-fuculose-phosphate aldolase [Anaerolineae bacterium]